MLFPLRLGDGGTTVTLGPPAESRDSVLCTLAASCLRDPLRGSDPERAPRPRSSLRLPVLDPAELTLIEGLRLGVGDCGDEFTLECREWLPPAGFDDTNFERKLGAILLALHQIVECVVLSPGCYSFVSARISTAIPISFPGQKLPYLVPSV